MFFSTKEAVRLALAASLCLGLSMGAMAQQILPVSGTGASTCGTTTVVTSIGASASAVRFYFVPGAGQTFSSWSVQGDIKIVSTGTELVGGITYQRVTIQSGANGTTTQPAYGKGRINAFYTSTGVCPPPKQLDIYKTFSATSVATVVGPTCIVPGVKYSYSVTPPIISTGIQISAEIGVDRYKWYLPAGTTVSSYSGDSSSLVVIFPSSLPGGSTVKAEVGRCNFAAGANAISLAIGAQPAEPLITLSTTCQATNSFASFTATVTNYTSAATYTWGTLPTNWTLTTAVVGPNLVATITPPSTLALGGGDAVDVVVTASYPGGCDVATSEVKRFQRQLSAANVLSISPSVTCLTAGTSYTFSFSNPPTNGGPYIWQLPSTWVTGATFVAGAPGGYKWYETSGNSITVTNADVTGTLTVRTKACVTGGVSQTYTVNGPNGCLPGILDLGCGTFRVSTACRPAGATYTWEIIGATTGNQGPFSSGTSITYSFPTNFTNGTVRLTVTASGCTQASVNSAVTYSWVTGQNGCRIAPPTTPGGPIKGDDSPAQLRAFPNPTGAVLNVELPAEAKGTAVKLTVVDATGRVRLATTTDKGASTLDVRALPEGVYSLKAQMPNGEVLTQTVQVHH